MATSPKPGRIFQQKKRLKNANNPPRPSNLVFIYKIKCRTKVLPDVDISHDVVYNRDTSQLIHAERIRHKN